MFARGEELWRGGATSRVIGLELGVTRNAVIGVAHRRAWGRHGENRVPVKKRAKGDRLREAEAAVARVLARKRERERIKREARIRASQSLETASPGSRTGTSLQVPLGPRRLVDLERWMCRWPVEGSGAATIFCGAVVEGELVYCVEHCARAWQRPHGVRRAVPAWR
jgi:hypothetical protein